MEITKMKYFIVDDISQLKVKIVEIIKGYFDISKISYNKSDSSFNAMLCNWLNVCDKRIAPLPRHVQYTKELAKKISSKELDENTIKNIEKFKARFQNGEDINSYLSNNINNTSFDKLLTMWRIHHLHLTDDVALPNKMSKRSDKYLLFIIFNDVVYFLDQTPHLHKETFASRSFLQILKNNDLLEYVGIYPSENIVEINEEVKSDQELYKLWTSHINLCVFKIENQIFQTCNGQTLLGTNLNHQLTICNINKILNSEIVKSFNKFCVEFDENLMQLNVYVLSGNEEKLILSIKGD